MALRCILVPSTAADDNTDRLKVALSLSQRLQAHIRLLYVRSDPTKVYANLPEVIIATGVTAKQIDDNGRQEAERCRTAFEQFCAKAAIRSDGQYLDLQSTFGTWIEQVGDVESHVALAGRVSDLILVNRPDPSNIAAGRIFDTAVFSTGRPALVVPQSPADDLLRHVVIAWNGSLEAARLIGHSVELFRAADQVSIVTVASERSAETAAADLQDYLMWHGVRARQIATSDKAETVGGRLLETATRAEATMLVMGAYTHSRIRQFLLGGVTHHMLHHSPIPLLMEH
jgi:nucleotide-binding universal stress UspA family protein